MSEEQVEVGKEGKNDELKVLQWSRSGERNDKRRDGNAKVELELIYEKGRVK